MQIVLIIEPTYMALSLFIVAYLFKGTGEYNQGNFKTEKVIDSSTNRMQKHREVIRSEKVYLLSQMLSSQYDCQ